MKYKLSNQPYTPRVKHNVDGWKQILLLFEKHGNKAQEFDNIVSVISPNHPTSTPESFVRWHIRLGNLILKDSLSKEFTIDRLTGRNLEHYEVAKTFEAEFTLSDFKDKYLSKYPSREPGSILPTDYAWNNDQRAKDEYPSFLEICDRAKYKFVGLEEGQKKKKKRNPPWSRDELIIALDFYFENRESPPGKTSDEIQTLSNEISSVGNAIGLSGDEDFRNANGVYMKLMNFRGLDPQYGSEGKVGLEPGGRGDEEVWNEFSGDLERLSHAAKLIRHGISSISKETLYFDEPEIAEAAEGRVITRIHRGRERSKKLVNSKKSSFLKKHGRLFCEACEFDFASTYGERGQGFIECHHTIPVNTLEEGAKTKLNDLVLLCSNCHRMVHAKAPWLTVEELKLLLAESRS